MLIVHCYYATFLDHSRGRGFEIPSAPPRETKNLARKGETAPTAFSLPFSYLRCLAYLCPMQTVAFYTLGCKLNFSETSAIGRQFLEAGFVKTDFDQPADVYVVNTCSVTEQANKKCRNIIRRAQKANPEGYVIVVGCYAQLKPQEIAEIPGVDMVLGANEKFRILELVEDFKKEDVSCVYNGQIDEVTDFVDAYSVGDRTRSFLKIQDGCDYKCAFCTIPLARGKSRSDTLPNILRNARELAAAGVKEIVLTGVNIGDYGKGLGADEQAAFLDVIQALDEVEGIARFRISSIEPNLTHNGIIEFVARSQRFMPHFHMPLQSGNNDMLALMRRRYRREWYADRVALIKELMPHAAIGVDVITGHPGESEARFEDTYQFLTELRVSYLHVFTYSEREDTHALCLDGIVDPGQRQQRTKRLRMLSEKKRRVFYEQFVGQTRPVLFEAAPHDGQMQGFTDNYIKVVAPYDEALVNRVLPMPLSQVEASGQMRTTSSAAVSISPQA
jgi:threonylcarbamoyladenosine tRNA methylthiotransferase MtaB